MIRIPVKASRGYDVMIGRGLFETLGSVAVKGRSICVVSDTNVAPLYLEKALSLLRSSGYNASGYVFDAGEASKNGNTYLDLLNFLASMKLDRSGCVVALGGGVVGDLAGFAAATYLRGVHFIQVPTTLLACVDSSVGGKVAIDLAAGKNLAGAFYQPDAVICDPDMLRTLPEMVYSEGCGEIIKYGMYGDAKLLGDIAEGGVKGKEEQVIARCVEMKRDIVAEDEYDTGKRAILNFGHTFAHSVEKLSGYTIPHGRAVSIGMTIITRAAVDKGLCAPEVMGLLSRAQEKCGLDGFCPFTAEQLAEAALTDKKIAGDVITLAVPTAAGRAELRKVPVTELIDWARAGTGI